jgi:hypothetical protein
MKKNALIIFLLLSSVSKAQVWFDLGINGGIGTGFYTNKIFYNDNRFNLVPRIGSSASFKVGINPSEKHAVVLEIGYVKRSYSVDQAFVPGTDQKNVFNEETSFNGFQTAVLYRKTTEGTFFEIGPMWSKIRNQHKY